MDATVTRLKSASMATMARADNLTFMRDLESGSIKLIVTSPPYNIGKCFDTRAPLEEYTLTHCPIFQDHLR